jgi:D-arabinose 1-dehydrogenase-like Zn-dependent alcohol dehydrogenase
MVDTPDYLVDFGDVPEDFAATLACSGLTSYSALLKAGPVGEGDPFLIIGAGGVGLAAVALAKAVHGVSPVVADIDPAKREAALEAGASMAVDPRDPGIRKQLIKQVDGFASVVDFVGAEATAEFGLSVLRKGGKMVLVGLFGGALELPLPTVPLRGISIIGSYVGSLAELRELADLAKEGKIRPMPLEIRPMRAAQETLDDLRAGRIFGRAILRNE